MHYRRPVMLRNFRVSGSLLIIAIILILECRYGSCQLWEWGTTRSVPDIQAVSDNPKDKSICKRYHRVSASRHVSYRETFMSYDDYDYASSLHTRINYRHENLTKWEAVEMCCEGYEPHLQAAEAEKCVPICLSDCLNGTCLRPNVCTCDAGYREVINKLTEYSECVPICPSGCRGGNCIAPHTCSCDYGYSLAKDEGSCEPTCNAVGDAGPRGCVANSTCIAPDTCQCDDGYTPTETSSSVVNPLLINRKVRVIGEPLYGDIKPTFNTSTIACKPLCEEDCGVNSNCVSPNKCQCNSGYAPAYISLNERNHSDCMPICAKYCFNGFCETPNKCTCLGGYKPHHWDNEDYCEPICQKECVNAKCSLPNRCECIDGYEKLIIRNKQHEETSENICVPVCPGKCPNGTCVSPGQCQCNAGYVLDYLKPNGTIPHIDSLDWTGLADIATTTPSGNPMDHLSQQYCRPLCEPDCAQGYLCIAPNRCQSETKRDRHFNDLPKIRTQIFNSTEDCSNDDGFHKENGECICEYYSDDRRCTEPALRAVILTDDQDEVKKFVTLQSIVLLNKIPGPKNRAIDWRASRCTDKSLISIVSKKFDHTMYKKMNHCYLLDAYNASTALVTTAVLPIPFTIAMENGTLICSVNLDPTCSPIESKMVSGQVGGLIGGIVGAILLVALLVGLVGLYLARRKMNKIGVFGGMSRSNGNMMEQSEAMESPLHAVHSSHL